MDIDPTDAASTSKITETTTDPTPTDTHMDVTNPTNTNDTKPSLNEHFLHQHITQKRPKGWGLLELSTLIREYEKTHGGQDKLMKAFYTAMHAATGTNEQPTKKYLT